MKSADEVNLQLATANNFKRQRSTILSDKQTLI